ncbi:MAG: hypothetical protein ACRDP6_32735 [Actinoallomurus sp.]
MTDPFHDGEDPLNRLYKLLARSRVNTQNLEEMIAEEEGVSTPELVQRRRRMMRDGLAWIPGLGGVAALGQRVAAHSRDIVVAGSAAATVATAVLGINAITGPEHHRAPPTVPPAALPPAGHQPHPTDPPKSGPPVVVPSPSPGPTAPVTPPPVSPPDEGGSQPPTSPPATDPGTSPPSTPSEPDEPVRQCRIYLPYLGICLLPLRHGSV